MAFRNDLFEAFDEVRNLQFEKKEALLVRYQTRKWHLVKKKRMNTKGNYFYAKIEKRLLSDPKTAIEKSFYGCTQNCRIFILTSTRVNADIFKTLWSGSNCHLRPQTLFLYSFFCVEMVQKDYLYKQKKYIYLCNWLLLTEWLMFLLLHFTKEFNLCRLPSFYFRPRFS